MTIREKLQSKEKQKLLFLSEPHYDVAILGVVTFAVGKSKGARRVLYSEPKLIDAAMQANGWDFETAHEYLEYNTFQAYVGKKTPYFVDDRGPE